MNYSTSLARVGAVATVVALLMPQASVFAATQKSGNVFCNNLSTLSANITARIPKRQSARDQGVTALTTKVGDHFQLRTTTLDDNRATRAQDLQNGFAKLEAAAKTPDQQTAVKTYESTVTAAVTARESAVDAAVSAFQSGVNTLLSSRQTTLDTAFTTLTSSTQAALATASASCASGTDGQTVRTTLVAAIKSANDSFRASVKPTDIKTNLASLKSTRDAAVKSAMSTFTSTVKDATATLKAAFGK